MPDILDPRRPTTLGGPLLDYHPISPAAALPLLLGAHRRAAVTEVGCRLGLAPEAAAINQALQQAQLCMWEARPRPAGGPSDSERMWAIYSATTSTECISLHRCADDAAPAVRHWADFLETFAAAIFARQPAPTQIFAHVAIPTPQPLYALFMQLGWDQWSTQYLDKEPPRFIFGLQRQVFDLYHEPADSAAPGV